jgi:polyisoprenoid-binding protein YceI
MIKKPAIALLLALFQFVAYGQQTYQLNVKKSKILWNTRQTMGAHFGSLLFNSGSLNYSAAGEPSDGSFTMDMNSIRSADHADAAANQKVDKELRTPGFFDVPRYPEANMNVKHIARIDNTITYKVTGDLTIKGITNPIEFTSTIKKDGNIITIIAKLDIHRLKWNIDLQAQPKAWDFVAALKNQVIADEIQISLNLVFNQ